MVESHAYFESMGSINFFKLNLLESVIVFPPPGKRGACSWGSWKNVIEVRGGKER